MGFLVFLVLLAWARSSSARGEGPPASRAGRSRPSSHAAGLRGRHGAGRGAPAARPRPGRAASSTPGENADYQRALDAYESAKTAADSISEPEQVKHVTEILEDGRYAMACVRARVAGEPLPTRRPPCFFDPRHGLSVEDVALRPARRHPARRARLRPGRRARPGRRRARHPQGDGRLAAGALLAGRPRLPAVRRRATSAASG